MIANSKPFQRVVYNYMFICICFSSPGCNDNANQSNQRKVENSEEYPEHLKYLTLHDMALAQWKAHQHFAILVISSNNGEQIIQYPELSKAETSEEDVIEIQRVLIQKFFDYQGPINKTSKANQWFEAQLKAEKALSDFLITEPLSLDPTKLEELANTDEEYTDVLTRQKNLLEIIRRKKDEHTREAEPPPSSEDRE